MARHLLLLAAGFSLGLLWSSSAPSLHQPSQEELVKRVQGDIEESGKQVVAEVWSLIGLLKEMVREAPVPIGPMPHMEEKLKKGMARVMTAAEVTATQAFLGALEKMTIVNPPADWFVLDRVGQFFQVPRDDLQSLRKELTWSSIIVGLGIAKAVQKDRATVFSHYQKHRSWARVGLNLGLVPDGLKKALDGLFPQ